MLLNNRHGSVDSDAYRYGFNGMEKDDEIKGQGNSYTTHFRQYDPRLGRWKSIDPEFKKLTSSSIYSYSYNNPMYYIDTEGNIPYPVALKWIKNKKFVWGKQTGMKTSDQEYGWRKSKNRMHYGIDFNVGGGSFDLGIELLNLADGKVIESGHTGRGGNYIIIRHGNGYITRFFHMQEKPTLKKGDTVNEGDVIGKIGGTDGYPVHGHLEVAQIPDPSVSDDEAIKLFKSQKHHFNYRDIVGEGQQAGCGDLQNLSTVSDTPDKEASELENGKPMVEKAASFLIQLSVPLVTAFYSISSNSETVKTANNIQMAIINTKNDPLRFFKESSSSSGRVAGERNIPKGSPVFLTGNSENGYTQIRSLSGRTGWVSTKYLKPR